MQKFRVPPVPPRKTPLKPKKKTSKTNLSLVSEFDDLCQKSQVFSEGGEKEFLAFLENAKEWRRQMVTSESEAQRLSKLLFDTEKELQSKDQKIKQARQMVNLEMRERQKIEQECEELQKQWGSLQNLVNSKVGIVNNDTLQRIRSSVSSSILNTPIGKGKKRDEMIAEYSQESILDASDLFEDSVKIIKNWKSEDLPGIIDLERRQINPLLRPRPQPLIPMVMFILQLSWNRKTFQKWSKLQVEITVKEPSN